MAPETPYKRIRRLAVGGMGEIYLARRASGPSTDLLILKSLLPQSDDDGSAKKMFIDEGRLLTHLRHENIIGVSEIFEERGEPVIAMEYVDGESLSVLMRAALTSKRHQIDPFVHAIAQAALGLHAAHVAIDSKGQALNLIHRDVSPQNIMVGRNGVTKVLDFGIAKSNESSQRTRTGMIKGKLAYMAPEQLAGQPIDPRADLYSLGVVLWEITTGHRPFAGKSDVELVQALLSTAIPAPKTVAADYPAELEAVVLRALARDPSQRFQTGKEMADALTAYLAKRPAQTKQTLGAYVDALVGADLNRRNSSEAADAKEPVGKSRDRDTTLPGVSPTPKSGSATHLPTTFALAAESSLFDGLFRGVPPTAAVTEDLKHLGVDPKRLEPKYRVDVWARTIEVVRRHTYPDLAPDEANRRLGFSFSKGFEQTIGGRMVLSIAPFVMSKPGSLLAKIPRFFKLGRPDIDITWTVTSPTTGTLRVKDVAQVSPFFDVGLIQYMTEHIGAKVNVRVEWHSLAEFSIHYDW